MKTALTQLIEKLIDKYGSDNNFINEAITDAMLLKKAEKEQIKKSYGAGAMHASYDFDNVDSEKYYQKTFKSDE